MIIYTREELIPHIIVEFYYGSFVYGTMNKKTSDIDIVVIVDDLVDFSDYYNEIYEHKVVKDGDVYDYQYIKESNFIEMIKNHHIVALEGLFLEDKFMVHGNLDRWEEYKSYFVLNKWKLRQTISSIVSNAWAKCHKKLTVEKDYDFYRGLKSLFHCFRLLKFGIQIAKYGKIVDYSEANHYWEDLWEKDIVPSHKWEDYKSIYQPQLNELLTEFREYCPKPEEYIEEQNKKKRK